MLGACFGMGVGLFGISLMAGLAMHNPLNGKIGQLVGYYIVIGNSATALILTLSVVSTNTGMNHIAISYYISNNFSSWIHQKDHRERDNTHRLLRRYVGTQSRYNP
jgi:hypothetical protein